MLSNGWSATLTLGLLQDRPLPGHDSPTFFVELYALPITELAFWDLANGQRVA